MCFAARSQATPLLSNVPLLTWTINRECVTSAGMSFFGDLAAEWRLGGRKWNLFLDCETWKEMTADRCITIGGPWCSLSLNRRVMLISILSCVSASRRTAEWGLEVVWPQPDEKKTASVFLPSQIFLSHFYSSTWELSFRGGWVIGPIGSHGTAWSVHRSRKVRQFSRFIVSFYRNRALTWHDMTQS